MAIIPIYEPNEFLFRKKLDAVLTGAGMGEAGTFSSLRLTPITTAEKDALTDIEGRVVYDSDLGKLCVGTAGGWETVTST